MKNKVFIIAEAGVNHNGNLDIAYEMVGKAKKAGADAIKFQTFIAENLVCKNAIKANYQKSSESDHESQLEMLKKLQLTFEDFKKLKEYCDKVGILFMSSPFDVESIEFLNSLNMDIFKIPSGEITNIPYLIKIAETHKKVIISTGMSFIEEIDLAIEVLKKNGATDITVLHCNTSYPTPMNDVNLNAMNLLKERYLIDVGYSDHTLGTEVAIAAVALGAKVIEKHVTLDKSMFGPDHKASIDFDELKYLVKSVRNIEKALGNYDKTVTESEKVNRAIARKSIVAKKDIKCGEVFNNSNIAIKRSLNGMCASNINSVIGKVAKRDFKEDENIEL